MRWPHRVGRARGHRLHADLRGGAAHRGSGRRAARPAARRLRGHVKPPSGSRQTSDTASTLRRAG
eukprot:5720951-Heterocapsa_arctica.AAC.1